MAEWTLILEGERADRAREVAGDLARAIAARSDGDTGDAAGMALFLVYCREALDREELDERATELLEQAVETIATRPSRASLHGGFTGVAWVVEHVAGVDPDDDDDPNVAIDEAIATLLASENAGADYDLISGLVGIAIYAVERLPRPPAIAILERIAALLEQRAEESERGLTWHTPPEILPPWQAEIAPGGYYNLGLAHGIPGIIGVLGKLAGAGIAAGAARRLLNTAVPWLLAQRLEGSDASFPAWLPAKPPSRPARTAWCYGDPGVAAALLIAARATGEAAWEREAVRLAAAAAERSRERSGVVDAGLCHGSFGLAQIFNRFFQATGDERFRDAAIRWIDDGLGQRTPGEGVAGFSSYRPTPDGEPAWDSDDATFLTGAAGVGLALLAACSDLVPDWDRLLLLDVPPA